MSSEIAQRVEQVRAVIEQAAEKSGRDADAVKLVAVTKFHSASTVLEAIEAGLTEFGENRFQEVPAKQAEIRQQLGDQADKLTWHFIGQLQSNKARKVLESFSMIQSVDRESLLERIDRISGELGRMTDILLQVNISGAETQGGAEPENVIRLAEKCLDYKNVRLHGLMAIGPVTGDRAELRKSFAEVRMLAEKIDSYNFPNVKMDTLSMGMSGDFDIAIEEGATLIRLGTILFGSRS